MTANRRRILFVAEAVTLAHLARPLALATGLDPARFEVVLACDPRCRWLTDKYAFDVRPLSSISSAAFLAALASGRPVYSTVTLREYVGADLKLIEDVAPDLIVGDFRLSLSVSARLAGIPYVAISNAYWSPYYRVDFRVPSLPHTRFTPIPLAQALFDLARPLAFALHARPLNLVRREHGLPSLGSDLRRTYTDADWVAYADLLGLFPLQNLPPTHVGIGPIIWSPPVTLPEWWHSLPTDRPIVYLTLGSSGRPSLLPLILDSLERLAVTVVATMAGNPLPKPVPANCMIAQYLPGDEAARRAALVICNGGSPTTQQALCAGVPVLGIAENLDQFLNMAGIEREGAGVALRADRLTRPTLIPAVQRLLHEAAFADAAKRLSATSQVMETQEKFQSMLDGILDPPRPLAGSAEGGFEG